MISSNLNQTRTSQMMNTTLIMQQAKTNMLKQQLRTGDVLNESILNLYDTTPRESFVPKQYESFAYSDMQIPLPHNQCMMTPLEEARILQALDIQPHEIVLEVGTGTGFLTALLSRQAKRVISIDYFAEITDQAKVHLREQNCTNVNLYTGDGHQGLIEKAPFDVIIFTGALNALTETHRMQLLPKGRLLAIIGGSQVQQVELHTLHENGSWSNITLFDTALPELINPYSSSPFIF
jgi:protein-L-isoaspartate(D-aspartate) O-methyltransferase